MTMPILDVSHQGEALSLHPITSLPQTLDIVLAQGAVDFDGMILHLLWRFECQLAVLPLTEERSVSIGGG